MKCLEALCDEQMIRFFQIDINFGQFHLQSWVYVVLFIYYSEYRKYRKCQFIITACFLIVVSSYHFRIAPAHIASPF